LIEVKSATSIQDDHIEDLAFQKHVLEGAGMKVRRCVLVYINREFVKQGEIDPRQFFVSEDLADQVRTVSQRIEGKVNELLQIARLSKPPNVEIGPRCKTPRECPLHTHCWSHSGWLNTRTKDTATFEKYEDHTQEGHFRRIVCRNLRFGIRKILKENNKNFAYFLSTIPILCWSGN
jgi:hypothetical protein